MIAATQNRTAQLVVWIRLGFHLERSLSYLAVLIALMLSLVPFVRGGIAQASTPADPQAELISEAPQAADVLADGVHLYGQSPEPSQIGAGYMVFEASAGNVLGALYMPHSSFDCFRGQLRDGELAMMITNSYTQETYPYSVALVTDSAIASSSDVPAPVNLEGFHQLGAPSDNDIRMLEVCKSNLGAASEL